MMPPPPPPPSPGNNVSSAVTSTITQAAKAALHAHFTSEDWPLNKELPRGAQFLSGTLGEIAKKFNLVRSQVARQLRNYKDKKYNHTQLTIILGSTDVEKIMRDGLEMSTPEFVSMILKRICNPEPDYGADFNNHSSAIMALPNVARTFLLLLAESPENSCFQLMVGLIEYWIKEMAAKFPNTAAGVSNAELNFVKCKEANMHTFIDSFMDNYESTGLSPEIAKTTFGHLGQFLHQSIFMAWSRMTCNYERPSIEFPSDCLVGKYAKPVIYYVAGWTLFSASRAKTVAKADRHIYYRFAIAQSTSESVAKNAGLPTTLVDRRKRKSTVYCTRQYYEFICFVESTYLANLSLKMMLAYNDGNIIATIKTSILSNNSAWDQFAALFDGIRCEKELQQLMAYVLERYANMRGTYFVRHLKCNSGNQLKKLVDNQATRTKVANAVYCAKVVNATGGHVCLLDDEDCVDETFEHDSTPAYEALWETAKESVFEFVDKEEEDDEGDSGDIV